MEELLTKSEELGKMLAEHPRFKSLMAARNAVRDDAVARKILTDYQTHVEKIEELGAQTKPIEIEDKRQLSQLEQAVASDAKLKELARAQADFSELMSRVNRSIYQKIASASE
jgi:cell fate (sporulation/competence/biofilm development) regulator YlbF (YheA/YmcA/DUF963 family)